MRHGFDAFAGRLEEDTVRIVRASTLRVAQAREQTLEQEFNDLSEARASAAATKQYVLDNLKDMLLELEARCTANGITVHWAKDAESARKTVLEITKRAVSDRSAVVVKGKSMATEEIHLNSALEGAGHVPIETDLGEFVVQLDRDTPSHIVAPIIHKDRRQVASSFRREGIGGESEDPTSLAAEAREFLRRRFQSADVGVSGVNFAIAETGRLVIVENEGNNRLSTTVPRVHIAVMGIEKILPKDTDLPLFIRLLAGSATGQKSTVYTHFVTGPAPDGPDEVHLVLLDNGRTKVLAGEMRDILRCIRCGACMNVCPVFRRASGHAYAHVYPGPLGVVLAPAMEGAARQGHLAKASTLCGSCREVCPVDIPIPDMILKHRGADESNRSLAWAGFRLAAMNMSLWRVGLFVGRRVGLPPAWTRTRKAPAAQRDFRRWWRDRA